MASANLTVMDLEEGVQKAKKQWETDPQLHKDRDGVIAKYGEQFKLENIDNLTAEKFQEFLRFENNKHWDRIQRPGGNLIKDMPKLKNALKILLDEKLSLSDRIKQVRDKESPNYTPYLANAIYTPILLVTNPKKYPVVNEPVAEALDQLGLYSYKTYANEWDWITIPKMQQIIMEVANKNNLDLWQVDWVWWKIARPVERHLPIALCWSVDDPSKIEKFQTIISQKGKSFWGINWSPSKLTKDDYPLIGYINYKRQIIAKGTLSSIIPDEIYQTLKEKDSYRIPQADYDPKQWKNYVEFGKLEKIEKPFPLSSLKLYFDESKPVPKNLQNKIYVVESDYDKSSMIEDVNYWKVSPGPSGDDWENQLSRGEIGIHFLDFGDLVTLTEKEIQNEIMEAYGKQEVAKRAHTFGQIRDFLRIKEGDIIVANKGKKKILGIGRVTGQYNYQPGKRHPHTYPVDWYDTQERDIPIQEGWMTAVISLTKEKFEELTDNSDGAGNYYIITQNEDSRYDDIPSVQYAYDSDKSHYKNFLVGTNFIVQTKIKKQNYFVGYGKVGKIEKSQGKNPYGNNITKIIGKFSKYTEFNDKKVRTENINEKMLQLAFPNKGARNIPPAMLQITKELYDEIINGKILADVVKTELETFENKPLPYPKASLTKIKNDIKNEIMIDDEVIDQIINHLVTRKNLLLVGPVGSGKTKLASILPQIVWQQRGGYHSTIVTATSEWTTQDVIGGIVPKLDKNNEVKFVIQRGCVTDTVAKNWLNQDSKTETRVKVNGFLNNQPHQFLGEWLVIDEFNRANIDKSFGQLFTALEYKKLQVPTTDEDLPYEEWTIPEDYRIIGTLNTYDKHFLFTLSDALKRRFAIVEINVPKYSDKGKEMFYVVRDALKIVSDHNTRLKIDEKNFKVVTNDKQTIEALNQMFEIMSFIRKIKSLGTAILISMFSFMLSYHKSTGNWEDGLDMALTSSVVPQLETLRFEHLEVIREFIRREKLGIFFKKLTTQENKPQQYQDVFKKFVDYMKEKSKFERRPKPSNDVVPNFVNGNLSDANVEKLNQWDNLKKPKLLRFSKALAEIMAKKGISEESELEEEISEPE